MRLNAFKIASFESARRLGWQHLLTADCKILATGTQAIRPLEILSSIPAGSADAGLMAIIASTSPRLNEGLFISQMIPVRQ